MNSGLPVMAEDLDAALAEQKKKAQRRVYSEYARIENRNLVVPAGQTEEEKLVDKKLREKEALAEQERPSLTEQLATQAAYTRSRAQGLSPTSENTDWLTTAVWSEITAEAAPDVQEDSWLALEQARRQADESAKKEKSELERFVQEQPRIETAPVDPLLKKYQTGVQTFSGNRDSSSRSSLYTLPGSTLSSGLSQDKKTVPTHSRFSPQAVQPSSALQASPFQTSLNRLNPPVQSQSPSANSLSPNFTTASDPMQPVVLSPLQKIKQAAPIHQADPFSDSHMPKVKTSIWE